MAPSGESIYFPPLEKCLSDGHQLISWKTVFTALLDPENVERGGILDHYLSDETVINILAQQAPFDLYSKPSQQSKTSFETKTAAINITPTKQGQYDINEIKEDALWLSKEATIDEIAALRIVIQEWQNRPAVQLLSEFSEEEVASIQDASGVQNLRSSVGGAKVSSLFAAVGTHASQASEFLLPQGRHSRFFGIYLSERRYALKASQILISAGIRSELSDLEHENDAARSAKWKGKKSWLQEMAKPVHRVQMHLADPTTVDNLLPHLISSFESRILGLESGSRWFKDQDGKEELEDAWSTNMIEEAIHILQIMFAHLYSTDEITSPRSATLWFHCMDRHGFFEGFNPPSESQRAVWTPFQSLLAIVSLAILQLPRSILFLTNPESKNRLKTLDDTKKQFCTDHDAVHELNEIFTNSAAAGLVTASPAVVAWAMILHTIWMQAVEDKEDRELQQSQIAMDDFNEEFEDSPLKQRSSSLTWSAPPISSLKPTLFEDLYEVVNALHEEGPVTFMARSAIDKCHVFEAIAVMGENLDAISDPRSIDKIPSWIRIMFIDLLRGALNFLDYTPELVSSLLSLLAPPAKWEDVPWMDIESVMDDPRRYFIEDSELMDKFYRVAQSRFPYETLPYLRLSKALAAANVMSDEELPFVVLSMRYTPSYTEQNPEEFGGYHTIREDENANFVSLTQPLAMFPLSQPRALFSSRSQNGTVAKVSYILQPGTVGRVISESKPAVIVWTYEYHGLSYFGRWLEVFFSKQLLEMSGSEDIAVEVVGFLAALVESSVKVGKTRRSDKAFKEAQDILELASDDIDRSGDIISVVLGILEQELQNVANLTSSDRPLDLVLACLHFLRATTKVLPGRVWPFLARSSFLGLEGRGGMLGAILSAVELPSGNFEFLIASIQVFATLIEDAVTNAVGRKSSIENPNRTSNANLSYSGTPTHVMTKVLHAFGHILVEVYESSASWRFVDDLQRLEINTALTSTFDKILYYAYGVDEIHNVSEKATSVLSTFAPYLLDFFLTQSPRDITFNPPLRVLFEGITTPQSSVYIKPRDLWVSQVQATLRLANTLVRAGRLLGYPVSSLERQLFQASPVLVRLYASDEGYKHLVVTLLETLIKDAGSREGDPPSLLGNLGTLTARNFGDCLSFFDKPTGDVESEIRIWNLLSALVSNRQQWIAIVLLTGSTPRNKLMKKDSPADDSMRSKPLLETAVSLTSNIEALEPRLAVAILEFVALSQEHWPWAVEDFNQYPQFLPSLFDYMSRIEYAKDSMISNCYTARIASLVADIIAVFLHHSRLNGGDFATRQKNEIRKALPWLVQNGAHSTGYNSSLHRNLEKNLAKCYPGCKLLDFKRTSLQKLDFGRDFLYDTHVAEKLLSYNQAWRGRGPSNRDQGFEGEFHRANINLSKFEAQSLLLHSWKFLASELCHSFISDLPFQGMMVKVAIGCLNANLKDDSPEAIFANLMKTRAEFAGDILQRLTGVPKTIQQQQKHQIISTTIEAIRATGGSFAGALLNGTVDYYRLLLRVLFLALQILASEGPDRPEAVDLPASGRERQPPKKPIDILGLVLEILTTTVAQGFRALTSALHEDPTKGNPADFAILDAILRSCLQIKDVHRIYPSIIIHFGDGAARSAVTLFSYAEKLTLSGDPIYGDLSIRFLFQLSTIPALAEMLATEGLLSNLSASALTHYFRRPKGSGAFDSPQRMFTMWANGILPICINLLDSVGRSMASEISSFLNQFQPQLDRATSAFTNRYVAPSRSVQKPAASSITLSMASEASSLALIAYILETYRNAGPSAGVDATEIAELKWDAKQVKEDIEELLGNRAGLRERIVATDDKETSMWKVHVGEGLVTRLEERIVQQLKWAVMCLDGGGLE